MIGRLRRLIVPPLLVILSPPFTLLIWHTTAALHGSLTTLLGEFVHAGVVETILRVWQPVFLGSQTAWIMIVVFAGSQLVMMRLLPGPLIKGAATPGEETPAYTANGLLSFILTVALYSGCSFGLKFFPASIMYDHFGELLGALNLCSLILCLFLYAKGHGRHRGGFFFDYFWGTELHPRLFGWDVKMFTNCHFGMMAWPLILLSFAAAQHDRYGYVSDSMLVAVGIQFLYIIKFYWWEAGYLQSLDMIHDRAGFYICWGCLVWLPSVYTLSTLYLVDHPNSLGTPLALLISFAGIACIVITYLADEQRQRVRETGGKATVWGKAPVLIIGHYKTENGEAGENLLLASGWWGVARHFNYVPEFLAGFFWIVPALFDNLLPYFYLMFLAILLVGRTFRDDQRCAAKYGADWDKYRKAVPYRIIPGVI
jgi:7-dehydrocholesterol reductase